MSKKKRTKKSTLIQTIEIAKPIEATTILHDNHTPAETTVPPDQTEVNHAEEKIESVPGQAAQTVKTIKELAKNPEGFKPESSSVPVEPQAKKEISVSTPEVPQKPPLRKAAKPSDLFVSEDFSADSTKAPIDFQADHNGPQIKRHEEAKQAPQRSPFQQHEAHFRKEKNYNAEQGSSPGIDPTPETRPTQFPVREKYQSVNDVPLRGRTIESTPERSFNDPDTPSPTATVNARVETPLPSIRPNYQKPQERIINGTDLDSLPLVTPLTDNTSKNTRSTFDDRDVRLKTDRSELKLKERQGGLSDKTKSSKVIDKDAKIIEKAPKTAETVEQAEQAKQAAAVTDGVAQGTAGSAAGGITSIVADTIKKIGEETDKSFRKFAGEGRNPFGNDQSAVMDTVKIGSTILSFVLVLAPMMLLTVGFVIIFLISIFTTASNQNLSEKVVAWMPQINASCSKYNIPEYTPLAAAIMMQESGGDIDICNGDLMQCAEGMGLPVGTAVDPEQSIDFGVKLIAGLLQQAEVTSPADLDHLKLAIQAYNFGSGYISYALARDGKYTKENAESFARRQAAVLGWSSYGDTDYVDHVLRYYSVSTGSGVGEVSPLLRTLRYPMDGYSWTTYSGHEGIDLPCEIGTPVYASASGTVWYTKSNWTESDGTNGMMSYGNCVCIKHENGIETRYGHLSYCVVSSGQQVVQGQLIGYSGNSGNSTGPHMHFAVYINGSPGSGGYSNNAALAFPDQKK